MSAEWVYPIELRHEAGQWHAYSAALPEAIASGDAEADALREMGHALAAAVRGRIKDGMALEVPGNGIQAGHRPMALPARLATEAAV